MKISVVIAAFNEEKLIGPCLDAVLHQTLSPEKYEIILIDNNSTDNTAQIAREKGVKVISYTEKKGAIWSKQFGVKGALNEIVAITDADTIPEKEWLENILYLFEDKKKMCVGGTVLALGTKRSSVFLFKFFDVFARGTQYVGIPFIWGPNMAFRKKAFDSVGGFNTKLKTSDDWEFVLRMQKKFGVKSAVYSSKLRVKSSPRKHEKITDLVPYLTIGFVNFFSIFIFRKSYTFGNHAVVR